MAPRKSGRTYLLSEALSYLPKIIELLDRNPFSKTYGCFDRSFWHYRTADFPSGMYQEYVLPLALVYQNEFPGNPFYQEPRIREWVIAGIDFARRSSHADGSCDDYYPFEKALGAAAFSLYAASEAYLLLKLDEPKLLEFLKKRARWVMKHGETGRLSNHHALVGLALWNMLILTGDETFRKGATEKIRKVLSWQTKEGWFPEYEGCDPGYLSICVDFLAKYYQKSRDTEVLEPLRRAVRFMTYFLHPDGSYGGEYGSRNTFHFFPHGLEVIGSEIPEALALVDDYLEGASQGRRAYTDDDRIFGHLVYNYLQAYLDYNKTRPQERDEFQGTRYFPESGLYVRSENGRYLVANLKKGGVFKYFEGDELKESDTGILAKTQEGEVLVSQIIGKAKVSVGEEEISVSGWMHVRPDLTLGTLKFILFRLFLFVFGRFSRNLVRGILQRKIIFGKKKGGARFLRRFVFKSGMEVEDCLELTDPKLRVNALAVGSDLVSIYVATSQPYQSSCLKPWTVYPDKLNDLNAKRKVSWMRRLA